MIDKAKKYTDSILFVGSQIVDEERTDPIPWNTEKSFLNKYIDQYENKLKEICQTNNIFFIDMQEELSNRAYKDFLFTDGLHMNEAGHELVVSLVKEKLDL